MAIYTITRNDIKLTGGISLPSSKSISNRLLIIRALSKTHFRLENLSMAEDTLLLQKLLNQIGDRDLSVKKQQPTHDRDLPDEHEGSTSCLDCGNAGTVMRFLTAYVATQPGRWLLSGSNRMHKRPIGILVEALRSLGASIHYVGTPGYPPLEITGKPLRGGEVRMDASVSSQFVSALLMIAPNLPEDLTIRVIGDRVSFPYVEMTIRIMEEFGAIVERKGESLIVKPGRYRPETIATNSYVVEADWSSAAFWYEAAALAGSAEITLYGLQKNSIQGDAVLAELFRPLGVETVFEEIGVKLTSGQLAVGSWQSSDRSAQPSINSPRPSSFVSRPSSFDLSSFPDLAPPLIVACAVLGIPARFSGLHHLKIKESDRLESLIKELKRLRIPIRHPASGIIETAAYQSLVSISADAPTVTIETYDDHRIAMAFALLAIRTGVIRISDPSVVSKSYPSFWEEMRRIGFEICETKDEIGN